MYWTVCVCAGKRTGSAESGLPPFPVSSLVVKHCERMGGINRSVNGVIVVKRPGDLSVVDGSFSSSLQIFHHSCVKICTFFFSFCRPRFDPEGCVLPKIPASSDDDTGSRQGKRIDKSPERVNDLVRHFFFEVSLV